MITAIIVDDEARSIDNLERMLSIHCPQIHILTSVNSVERAYQEIERLKPEIVFLDIDMPPYTGFDLLRKYEEIPFEIIFVTAFDYFAIDAIKFSASYYIIKPIDKEELILAVEKINKSLNRKTVNKSNYFKSLNLESQRLDRILVNSTKKSEIINLDSICYIKSDKDYSTFHLVYGKKITCSQRSLKDYEETLSDKGFFRTHKSYLVNLSQVDSIDKLDGHTILLKSKDRIPLSFRRRNRFYSFFKP
jgi:two-component system LytT family response regulator